MANVKITELPAATSITPGSDVLPLVSGGITTKATPDQIVNSAFNTSNPTIPATGTYQIGSASNGIGRPDNIGLQIITGDVVRFSSTDPTINGDIAYMDNYGSLGLGTTNVNPFGLPYRTLSMDAANGSIIDMREGGVTQGIIAATDGHMAIVSSTDLSFVTAGDQRLQLNTDGSWVVGTGVGQAGQMLISGGTGAEPSWSSAPVIRGGSIDNSVIGATVSKEASFSNSLSLDKATGTGNGFFVAGDTVEATNPQLSVTTDDVANAVYLDVSSIAGAANSDLLFSTGGSFKWLITSTGDLIPKQGTRAMTNGFAYIPAAAGTPTGTPTGATGAVPLFYDTVDGALFAYNGAWQSVNFQPNHVEARLTSSLTINNTTDTAITWNQIDTDETQLTYSPSLRQWQNSSNRSLTVIIAVTVAWPSASGGARAVFITRNGNAATGTNRMAENDVDAGSADFDVQNVASSFSLAPGDYFQVYAWQNSGGGIDIGGAAGGMSANYSTRLQVTVL
jgi:hypothetical protein